MCHQGDMELDHEDHPLAMANWTQHSYHTFMKFILQQQTDNFTQKLSHQQQVSYEQLAGLRMASREK